MTLVVYAILLFLLLLLLPIGFAVFWYFRNKNARDSVLPVRQNRTRDPRYFANAYKKLFEEAWAKASGNTLTLHKTPEVFIRADTLSADEYPQQCEHLMVAEKKNFCPPSNLVFEKEIYAKTSAFISGNTEVRAIHAEENLDLADDSTIVRWADADGVVTVGNDCILGMSLTSGRKIILGKNCLFRRLYAPLIQVGIQQDWEKEPVSYPPALDTGINHFHKRHVKKEHMGENGILENSVLSRGKLWVDDDLVIQGSLHAEKGVRIGCRSVVCGNIFSSGDVYLRKDCRVLGNIFAQGDIYLESGVQVGLPGNIRSIVARQHVTLEDGSRVYGYISCEDTGICAPSGKRHRDREAAVGYAPHEQISHVVRRRSTGIAVLTISAAAIILVTLAATLASQWMERPAETDPVQMEVDLYRNQGLEPGAKLESKPLLIMEDRVEFKDRMMLRCIWTRPQQLANQNTVNKFLSRILEKEPEVNVYSMAAPLRIAFEEKFSEDPAFLHLVAEEKGKMLDLEKRLQVTAPDKVTFLPVIDALAAHEEEYLFYRSSETWTARGAYYAAQEFLKQAGLGTFPISSFYESARTSTSGALQNSRKDFHDRQYAYLYQDYNPMVQVEGSMDTFPMFSTLRSNSNAFMGNKYGVGRIDGLSANGRVLLLAGARNAGVFAPWMVTQFDQIIYVNVKMMDMEKDPFWELFEEYQVTDFLLLQDQDGIGDKHLNARFGQLTELP